MPACGLGRRTVSISFPISQTKKEKTLKIKLLAGAALCACAGAASAQSSVTLFGIVDLNGRWLDNDGTSQFSMSQGGNAASRLGFRGTEDLGGGLYAGFWIEGALNPDTGTSGGQTWQRRSTVSLSSPWGEARLGRDNTVTYYNTTTFDPFGDSGLGAAGNLTLKPPAVPVGGAYDTLVRASNMALLPPAGVAGGLHGAAQVAAGESTSATSSSARAGYAAGPFDVNVAWDQTQSQRQRRRRLQHRRLVEVRLHDPVGLLRPDQGRGQHAGQLVHRRQRADRGLDAQGVVRPG
jgi:predicted porin